MKRLSFIMIAAIMVSVMISGCVTMKTVEHERVDQSLSGNQGYLVGEPTYDEVQHDRPKTKKFFKIEVDMSNLQRPRVEDPKIESRPMDTMDYTETETAEPRRAQMMPGEYNRGVITPEAGYDKGAYVKEEVIDYDVVEEETVVIEPEPSFTYYTVKKNESLWDIAGRDEVYGDPTKWKMIYEANQDQIKKPNLIRPGMKLRIPR